MYLSEKIKPPPGGFDHLLITLLCMFFLFGCTTRPAESLLTPNIETSNILSYFDNNIACLNKIIKAPKTSAPILIEIQDIKMDFITGSYVEPKLYIVNALSRLANINIKISNNDDHGTVEAEDKKEQINAIYNKNQLKIMGFLGQRESSLGGTGNINIRLPLVGTFMSTMNYRKKTLSILLTLVDTNDIIQTAFKQYGHHTYIIPLSVKVNVSYIYLSGGIRAETSKIIDEESDYTSYKYNLDFNVENSAPVNQAVELGVNTAIYILLTRYFNLDVSVCLKDKALVQAIVTDEKTHGRKKLADSGTLKISNRLRLNTVSSQID